MLSKLLKHAERDVKPLVWRREYLPRPKDVPSGELPVFDELSQLREKVAELTSRIEIRAQESFDAGLRAGDAAAKQSLEGAVRGTTEKLAATIAELGSLRAETIRRAEADTVRLAIEIARRVLHRELTMDTSALGALIKAALEKLQAQEVYRVRIHPDQEKIVRSCLDQMGRSQNIEVIHDASQQKGGAVFEISGGALDASVETQLREIECGLTDRLEARN